MKTSLIALFLLITFPFVAQISDRANYEGYQSQHAVFHWTTSNGLPQSHISGIAQSSDKLIWISTYNGIVCFDGKKFTPVEMSGHRRNLSSFVTKIQTFGDTVVWATSQEIVYYYKRRILTIHPILEKNAFIMSIQAYRGKHYYFGHNSVYFQHHRRLIPLYRFDSQNSTLHCKILTAVFHKNKMVLLLRDSAGKSFFYTYDYISKKRHFFPTFAPVSNMKLQQGQLLVLSEKKWLRLNDSFKPNKTIAVFSDQQKDPLLQSGIEGDCMFFYTRNQLILKHPNNNKPAVINTSRIMYGNELFASFRDHAGNLWLGTNSMGLFLFREYPFTLFNFLYNDPVTNSSHAFMDDEGLLWFDSDCKLTTGFDIRKGEIKHQLTDICNWTNAQWSKDSLVLFAYAEQHFWYNKRLKKTTPIADIHIPITNFLKVGPGHFILAGEGALYHWYGKKLQLWKSFESQKTTCNQLLQTGADDFYFATSEGLYHYYKGKWKHFLAASLVESSDFRSLYPIPKTSYLLIGTERCGILRFNTKNGSIDQLTKLPAQITSCWSMIEDRNHHLWITSNNGIIELDMRELMDCFEKNRDYLSLNHYKYENGLENVEFNSRTGNKGTLLSDGRLLFSGLGGPVIVDPAFASGENVRLGDLLIEKVTLNQQTLSGSFQKLMIREGDFMTIQFTVPSFASERVLGFEYKIQGYRSEWTPAPNRNITLDNLPTGNYLLEIRTTCNERHLRIPVSVASLHPNWWVAQLIFSIVFVVSIILVTIYFTKRNQQKKHALTGLKQQLKLLEMEALRSQMNPHFIFNCLNTIQFLFISGNVGRANKYLTNFSALMRMFLDLLREPITTLDLELRATELYIELEQLQFDNGFEYQLINNLKTSPNLIRVPSLFFQVFVENAVLHGLRKTTEAVPTLTLILDETDDMFIFRICDNGPGMSQQKKEAHTSLGIQLLRDRFALKREIYNWHMHFSVKENEIIQNNIKTEIIITFGKVLLETTDNEYPDRR